MLTQRDFQPFPNFNFASMASTRCHTTVTPSTWPSESLSVSCGSRGSFVIVRSHTGEPATPAACRETYDGGSTYKGRGNCGVPHYVYGETGKVLTKRDITGEATDERYAAADQFLLEEGARSSFLTILAHDLMEENKIEMPMNMPFTTLPPSKARPRRFEV